ncbi:MAG TPA: GDSL-type esterase/lipase family protein [Candidatus Dormibacteraeota bacterium]|nr:GDSL-type esterase/lipase family protein [Candidatus Dormibacteraeota bacterium]
MKRLLIFALVSASCGLPLVYLLHVAQSKRVQRGHSRVTASPARIVFFGDSITANWNLDQRFPGMHLVNRGAAADTTSKMASRFESDVVALRPKIVVILGGVNDIRRDISVEVTEANLEFMVRLAKDHEIEVILSSLLPLSEGQAPGTASPKSAQVQRLNTWLEAYARSEGCIYADYYSALANERGGFNAQLTDDGIHPNAAGYRVMDSVVQQVLRK